MRLRPTRHALHTGGTDYAPTLDCAARINLGGWKRVVRSALDTDIVANYVVANMNVGVGL